jgi:DNA-binding cell septation regulator SpoVG
VGGIMKKKSEEMISDVQVIVIRPENGLCGFVKFTIYKKFVVGNVAIYSSPTSESGIRLVYPQKKLANGQAVNCFFPITKEAGEEVTSAVAKVYLDLITKFNREE